jgi:transcriptional regulator
MRGITLIFLLTTWISCSNKNTENASDLTRQDITAIDAKFPLELEKIDLSKKDNIVHLSDQIKSKIEQTVKNYYTNDCLPDSLHTYKDTYINTIRLQDSLQTIFLVLLKHYPFEELKSKALFYDNTKRKFLDSVCDFRIYALFDFENGQLEPTNLKIDFEIDTPEIQLIDFDKDGINDFKFTRLYHNGTFNSIHTAILTVKNSNFDTLDFKEKGLGF